MYIMYILFSVINPKRVILHLITDNDQTNNPLAEWLRNTQILARVIRKLCSRAAIMLSKIPPLKGSAKRAATITEVNTDSCLRTSFALVSYKSSVSCNHSRNGLFGSIILAVQWLPLLKLMPASYSSLRTPFAFNSYKSCLSRNDSALEMFDGIIAKILQYNPLIYSSGGEYCHLYSEFWEC